MKATELRIGNLVNITFYDEPMEVHSICSMNNEIFNRTSGEVPMDSVNSIRLTEKWLIDYGFIRTSFGRKLGNLELEASSRLVDKDELCGFTWEGITEGEFLRIQYVHQLQNLFYSLTGTELLLAKNKTSTDESLETKS